MESSVDLFERQMATNQRVIKFRKKVRRSSSLIISLDIPSQSFRIPQDVFNWTSFFMWWKEKQLLADQIGWSTKSSISPANSQLLNFSLFWKLDLSNWWIFDDWKKVEMLKRGSLHKEMPEITEIVQILCTLTSLPHNINLLQVSKLSKKENGKGEEMI